MITVKKICIGSMAWMLATTAVVFIPNISPWIAAPFVLGALIGVLGLLLAIALEIKTGGLSEYALYAAGLGLSFLIIGGLFINWVLPYFGVAQPLAAIPLMIFFDISALLLSLYAYLFDKDYTLPYAPRPLDNINIFLGTIPWVFIVLSVRGAQLLNDGGSGTVTLVMLFAIALYVLVLMLCRNRVGGWVYISALYSISLSLLLMYSLRSAHVFGWDINLEYQVFQTTLDNLRWKMSYYPGLDYNACLSITLLPTILKELTGVPSEYIYKLLFQFFFAVTPVAVYVIARRYIKEPLAFLAAFFLLSQTWFFEQMPALIRQETAFVFYVLLVLALFDARIATRTRYILFYIFTVALILSHYSTAYVWIALMLITFVLSYGTRFFIPSLRTHPTAIKPAMLIIIVALLFIWQVPLTHISGTATTVATDINTGPAPVQVPSSTEAVGSAAASSSAPSGAMGAIQSAFATLVFANNNPNTYQNILLAQQYAIDNYGGQLADNIYANATTSGYVPTPVNENVQIPSKLPQPLSALIDDAALASKIVFIDIFPALGIIAIYLGMRRQSSDKVYDFMLLNIGAFGLILVILLFPSLQQYYNLTRLYLQMFFTLSTLAVIGGIFATHYVQRYQVIVLTILAVLVFGSLNGAFDQLVGGQARITLDQPPSTLDAPYIYDAEAASAQWIAANKAEGAPVQSDDVAYLRLQSFGDMSVNNSGIFPETIERDSYVYLIGKNISGESAYYLYDGNLLAYQYPLAFLNGDKDLIYNDGMSRIYR